ncbi:uncharacterized protein [Linepithema humile]|uniref:uncharacterized protein n=1 Tax=Linepithema humile TaxID=83485 RepID=UPI00351DECB7
MFKKHTLSDNKRTIAIPEKEEIKARWFTNIGREVGKCSTVCTIPSLSLIQSDSKNDVKIEIECDNSLQSVSETKNCNDFASAKNLTDIANRFDENIECSGISNAENTKNNEVTETSTLKSFQNVKIEIECDNSLQSVSETKNCNNFASEKNRTDTANRFDENIEIVVSSNDSECSGISNAENTKNNEVTETSTLKRTADEPVKGAKSFCNPQYVRDLQRENFTSDKSWKVVNKFVHKSRKQKKILYLKVNRLRKKIEILQAIIGKQLLASNY